MRENRTESSIVVPTATLAEVVHEAIRAGDDLRATHSQRVRSRFSTRWWCGPRCKRADIGDGEV